LVPTHTYPDMVASNSEPPVKVQKGKRFAVFLIPLRI
jgi:hypothetical protein